MFGFFKKSYPILTAEMIKPEDQLITTTEAKRIFKEFMKRIGYLEKDELSLHASYLSDEIKDHQEGLKDECVSKKEEIKYEKASLKKFQAQLKKVTGEDEEDVLFEIECAEDNLKLLSVELEEATEKLANFKKDKRAFLVEYINRQTQDT